MSNRVLDAAAGMATRTDPDARARPSPADRAPAQIRVAVVADLASLAAEWVALRRRVQGPSFYQSYEWCSAWVDACRDSGCPEAPRIVTVRQDGRLVLLWPLAVGRRGPVRVLHALGEPATHYCDVLVESSPSAPAWVERAWEAAASLPGVDVVRLRRVRADGRLSRLAAARLDRCFVSSSAAPVLRCEGQRLAVQRSGRSVNALRRHLKHLNELGPVRYEVVARADHPSALAEAFRLKTAWSRERGLMSAGYSHAANVGAILAVARLGLFAVRRLRVGDDTAAVEIGVEEGGFYCSMIQSYDARFAHHAPGRLLLWHIFQDRDCGITLFDFMPPCQPHKTEWTSETVTTTDHAVVRTALGRLYLSTSCWLKPRLKAFYARLPQSLRSGDGWKAAAGRAARRLSGSLRGSR